MLPGAPMFAKSAFTRALREAAPVLSKRFFSCPSPKSSAHRCSHELSSRHLSGRTIRRTANIRPSPILNLSRSFKSTRPVSEAIVKVRDAAKAKSRFPETSSNVVAYWLLGSAASVFGIVVFGGLTRLTESGLSITEWKPVTGSLPPMSDTDWESEFLKYQASPEFKVLNSRMTLEEFKSIYWMEWIHRLWGRTVGLSFVLPAAYFIATRRVSKPMTLRLGAIASLIGFQGFIGWWMVKSGLKDDLFSKPGSVPRVSQYRLAAHLGTAFVCYLAMVWNGLNILRTNKLLAMAPDAAASVLFSLRNPALRPFKICVALLAGLTFTTAMSGAFVAGLDAGLIYNEFPYMGLGLTPPRSELFDKFYSRDPDQKDLIWRNVLENPSLVQLDHRILATSTFTAVMALFAYTRFSGSMIQYLPKAAKKGMHGVVGFVWLQVILGISTLIYMVPVPLASAHQAGALALLTWTTVLGSRIWYPRYAARVLSKRLGSVKSASGMYQLPAVPRTVPANIGTMPAVQAGTSALFTGIASLIVASTLTEDNSMGGPTATEQFSTHQKDFLQKQAKFSGKD